MKNKFTNGLGRYISAHVISNPNRQYLSLKLAQIQNEEKNKQSVSSTHLTQKQACLSNLASPTLFINVKDPIAIGRHMPLRQCCIYFIINGGHKMYGVWEEISKIVAQRVGKLRENDSFGICVFIELKARHYIKDNRKY